MCSGSTCAALTCAPGRRPAHDFPGGRRQDHQYSSGAGKRGIARYAAYCASKFAIIGFTQAWPRKWPRTG